MLVFDSDGNLPAGVHELTWEEVIVRFGWNERRRYLLGGLKRVLRRAQSRRLRASLYRWELCHGQGGTGGLRRVLGDKRR